VNTESFSIPVSFLVGVDGPGTSQPASRDHGPSAILTGDTDRSWVDTTSTLHGDTERAGGVLIRYDGESGDTFLSGMNNASSSGSMVVDWTVPIFNSSGVCV
jgi:hypothetical protein